MLNFSIQDQRLTTLLSHLGSVGRTRIHGAMARGLYNLLRRHFNIESKRRHTTAHRLGAQPSGHLEAVTLSTQADASAGTVGIASPGIRRALGPLNIRPRAATALTIPIAAESYSKRAGELADQGWQLFRVKSKAGRGLLFGSRGKTVKPLYVLRTSALIPQDRTLLPSDQALRDAAMGEVGKLLTTIQGHAQ